MKIEIRSTQLTNVREYKGRYYGEQQAALHSGGDFPLAFKLNVEEGKAYAPGHYTLDPATFGTDQHGNLVMRRVRLVAVVVDAPAKTNKAA